MTHIKILPNYSNIFSNQLSKKLKNGSTGTTHPSYYSLSDQFVKYQQSEVSNRIFFLIIEASEFFSIIYPKM